MGLQDMEGMALVQSMRQSKPELRIMVIPLFGQDLTEEELALEVQGVLPKPFFMDDLPGLIRKAMTGESEAEQEIPAQTPVEVARQPPPEPPATLRSTSRGKRVARDVDSLLQDLFEEVRAEAVFFAQGSKLIAHAGNVTRERAEELAGLAAESLSAAHKIAAFRAKPTTALNNALLRETNTASTRPT